MKVLQSSALCIAALLPLGLALSQTTSMSHDRAMVRATPSPTSKQDSTYIPKDLADSLATLRRMLTPDDLRKIQNAREEDMIMYHHGLGTYLRNEWGLWSGSRLAKYFNRLGIHHPDDMSGIILTSFWRQLHNQPIRLEEQIRPYRNYWKAARAAEAQEKLRVVEVKRKIQSQMLGLRLATTRVQTLMLPERKSEGINIRSLLPFRQGFLLTAIEYRNRNGLPTALDFFTPPYFMDVRRRVIYPVCVAELDRIEEGVVAGGTLYLHGTKKGFSQILGLEKQARSFLPLPPGQGWLRLGQEGSHLLAVRPHGIYCWARQGWQTLVTTTLALPRTALPPVQIGRKIYFREESGGERDDRLLWLDLDHPQVLTAFDDNVGLVGSEGPRWENVFSFAPVANNRLWIATGSSVTAPSLVLRLSDGSYRVALFNGKPRLNGNLIGGEGPGTTPESGSAYVTAMLPTARGGMFGAGAGGLYQLNGQTLRPLVRFGNTQQLVEEAGDLHWDWIPTHLAALSDGDFVIGGYYGGTYLLNRTKDGKFHLISLDEKLRSPQRF